MLSVLIEDRENPIKRKQVRCDVMSWDDVRDWVLDNHRGWKAIAAEPVGYTSDYCCN